jgi:peptidoglycan/LPS O-acetylase OafA/YrhL
MLKSEAYPNLDLLRALAVLFVLFDHTANALGFRWIGYVSIEWLGRAGVLFFFVHTCCVLMMSLERDSNIPRFYLRRAFRIYPLSIVAVLCAIPIVSLHPWEWISNLGLIQNLTFARDSFGSIWSLPLEVQMYLFLPFMLWFARKSIWIPLGLFAASIPIALWQPHHVARASVLAFAPCFIPGVLAYWMFRNIVPRVSAWFVAPAILATTSIFLLHPNWTFSAWSACLVLGLVIPLFEQGRNAIVNRCAETIAKYSYGIYLSHSVLLLWATLTWKILPLYLFAVALSSWGCYRAIEHPLIQVGKRITTRKQKCQLPEPDLSAAQG